MAPSLLDVEMAQEGALMSINAMQPTASAVGQEVKGHAVLAPTTADDERWAHRSLGSALDGLVKSG